LSRTFLLEWINRYFSRMQRADRPDEESPEDFRSALAGVKRMPPSDRLPPVLKPLPVPHPRQRELDDAAVMAEG